MAKVLNLVTGIIGVLYICGQILYYGTVQFLKVKGYSQAELRADDHKIIFDWVIFMAFLLVILSCFALITNFIMFEEANFGLRVCLSIVSIFMPFMHIKNHFTILVEGVFLVLFGIYLYSVEKNKKSI